MMISVSFWFELRPYFIIWTPNCTCSGASAYAVIIILFDLAGIFFIRLFLAISISCCLVFVTLIAIVFAGIGLDKLRLCNRRNWDNLSCLVSDLLLLIFISVKYETNIWLKQNLHKANNKSETLSRFDQCRMLCIIAHLSIKVASEYNISMHF